MPMAYMNLIDKILHVFAKMHTLIASRTKKNANWRYEIATINSKKKKNYMKKQMHHVFEPAGQ